MSDQHRPQPYDDGPRLSVDPQLLPQHPVETGAVVADGTATAHASEGASGAEHDAFAGALTVKVPAQPRGEGAAKKDARHDTSRLDEAVARSRAISEDGSLPIEQLDEAASEPAAAPEPEPEEVRTTVIPESVAVGAAASGPAASSAATRASSVETEIFGDDAAPAPTEGLILEPDKRNNRGFAVFTALLATVVFAAGYATLFALARILFYTGGELLQVILEFVNTAQFYLPVTVFGLFLVLWSLVANRAGWWSYILAGVLAGGIASVGYYTGVAFQDVVNGLGWSNQTFLDALKRGEHLPGVLIAFMVARESVTWVGGLAAARGRRIKRKNAQARAEYERRIAEERKYEAQRVSTNLAEAS